MRLIVAALIALALAACGGGGGSAPAPASTPPPSLRAIDFGYFGVDDTSGQLAATAASVSFVFTLDEGDWTLPDYDAFRASTTITDLQQAQQRGIPSAIVSVGWLVFTERPGCTNVCYTPRADAIPRLIAFRQQLEAAGVANMVMALYPADEPELRGLTDAALAPLLAQIKAAWPKPLAVIYGTSGPLPGLAAYDWIGRDDYGKGGGVFGELPTLRADQRWIIVPGGADPYRQDPNPFVAFANGDARVQAVVAFLYAPYEGGKGIGTNGLLPQYATAGCALTRKC